MFPLIKIRLTYLKRKTCMLFWSYLLIPLILLLSIIIYLATRKGGEELKFNPKQTFQFKHENESTLFNYYDYKEVLPYLKNTCIISKNEEKGKNFAQFLKGIYGIDYVVYSDEKSADKNTKNLIIMNYDEKKDAYIFSYKQRQESNMYSPVYEEFPFSLISSQQASDIFSYSYNFTENNTDSQNISDIDYNNIYDENEDLIDFDYPYYFLFMDEFEKDINQFILYQSLISKFLIEKEKGISFNEEKNIEFKYGFNSFPEANKDPTNYEILGAVFCYIITFQYTLIFLSFSIQMIEEKELKLKKLLERQGIGEIKYILSWFLNYLLVGLLSDVVLIIGTIVALDSLQGLFILNLILYVLAQFPLIYLIVSIISTKKSGIILVNIIGFASLVVGFIIPMGETNRALQMVFNIFPNINEFSMLTILFKYEQIGVFSSDLLKLKVKRISYVDNLIMFFVEICFYSLICLFIILFQNSGLPFLDFIKSLFIKVSRKIYPENIEISANNEEKNILNKYHEELNEINSDLKNRNEYLSIKNITKIYGDLKAVNNFTGELFKNEIYCLLGHNGAGKTTLIKMISGTEEPDNGDIFLDNISIITNKTYLYSNIGLCQQEDILFDYLTVEEHLKYMMELKGSKSDERQINIFINGIDLNLKKENLCKTLSGGEKRKLCIAIALIGNSKLVLLDEPTSGMDVISKRKLWNFLKEFKKDKIIILTTHSLDEAEYLGDRIGIMSNGEFICSGTSSFLKSKYPCGFNLNFLVNPEIFDDKIRKELYNKLRKYEPKLEVKISSKGLFSVNIDSNNRNIKEIFNVIEENKKEYGIEDYTVSSTTLEDVFLKLNNKINLNEDTNNSDNNDNEIIVNDDLNIIIKPTSFISQLFSHIKRGFFAIWRNKAMFILELLIGLFTLYIYVLIQYNTLSQVSKLTLSFKELYQNNDIYVCKDSLDFFKSSYFYKEIYSVNFKIIDKKNNIDEFIEEAYQKSTANIAKSSLCIQNINSNTYEIYNTEVPIQIPAYIMTNIMLSVSSFLKKEYNINAAIFVELENLISQDIGGTGIDYSELSTMFTLCIACIISLSIYLGTIMADKIKERVNNIKHILYLSGANLWSYWCGFYLIDLIKILIFSSLASAILYIINDSASLVWIDLIITSFSILIFAYSLSFLLSKEESAQKSFFLIVFILIILFAVIIIILVATGKEVNIKFIMNKYNFTFFDITPITSFLLSYIRLIISYIIFKADIIKNLKEFEIPLFGKIYKPKIYIFTSIMVQCINLVFYTGVLILFESGKIEEFFNFLKVKLMNENNISFSNLQISDEMMVNNEINNNINNYNNEIIIKYEDLNSKDEINRNNKNYENNALYNINNNGIINNNSQNNNYIQNEINKINNDNENKLTIKIMGLKKTYCMCCKKNIRAINNLYLGLENNEKFGLLGFNGSGKSTTFKAITKEILYDSGSIILFGKDNKKEFQQIRNSIGYCPQENPIFDYMKVREIISFYLDLKKIDETPENVCKKFGLIKFLDTYCINLSGGNKRKLSFALALMCKPRLLLLDEPSTGVDPESRRIMWKNILELNSIGNKFNMILTTHSMEEAEVLCDTVSWLKSGNFISIGNPEKLKIALSAGYKLHLKFIQLKKSDNNLNSVDGIIKNLCNIITNFDSIYQINIENLYPYIMELEKVINIIKDKCSLIVFQRLNKDLSFDFNIKVIKEKQSELFIQVLEMKNVNNLISEISISMESLENILTRL